MMNRLSLIVVLGVLSFSLSAEPLSIGLFSSWSPGDGFRDGWETVIFKNVKDQTRYTLTNDDGSTVIRADSKNAASMLVRKIRIDPQAYPILQWRWKIQNTIGQGDVYRKTGDDYAARLYITFDYDRSKLGFFERIKVEVFNLFYGEYPPLRAISYIWDHKSPVGLVVANSYTDHVMMFVIESGAKNIGQWINERRNIADDYKVAFGESAPPINGIALMTDTDNTGSSATAWYGDIGFE